MKTGMVKTRVECEQTQYHVQKDSGEKLRWERVYKKVDIDAGEGEEYGIVSMDAALFD